MAIIEPIKKGGPYTLIEQIERKLQVHHLHYEEKKSALQIAKILNVNRNTVNNDIKFWYQQLEDHPNGIDIVSKMIEQIHRMEKQRNRLESYLENAQTLDDKIKLEKQISEADIRLVQFFSKSLHSGKDSLGSPIDVEYISEEEMKNLVRSLVAADSSSGGNYFFTERQLKTHIIWKIKCDLEYAEKIIEKMKKDGLGLCEKLNHDLKKKGNPAKLPEFSLTKFAYIRGYITAEEMKATVGSKTLKSRISLNGN